MSAIVLNVISPAEEGAAAIESIRNIDPTVGLIVTSPSLDAAQHLMNGADGPDAVIQKPYTAADMLNSIAQCLGRTVN